MLKINEEDLRLIRKTLRPNEDISFEMTENVIKNWEVR